MDSPRATLSRRAFLAGLAAGAAVLSGCGDGPEVQAGTVADRTRVSYGRYASQSGDLTLPVEGGPHPVVVLIHGGYWQAGLDRRTMVPLGEAVGRLGYAVWNVDYRTVGPDGGGWTATFDDVGAAIDHLDDIRRDADLDLGRVVAVGHSAGGHLALWAATRRRPSVPVTGVVSFAGVPDLAAAARAAGDGNVGELRKAVVGLVGGTPEAVPERYAKASPVEQLPLRVPQLVVHGVRDDRVPIEQARRYAAAATRAGDALQLVEVPTGDHGDITRSDRSAWPQVASWLTDRSASRAGGLTRT